MNKLIGKKHFIILIIATVLAIPFLLTACSSLQTASVKTSGWWNLSNEALYPEAAYNGKVDSTNEAFAGKRKLTVTVDGELLTLTHYWGWYYEKPTSTSQRFNIYVPDTADASTPIFAIVNNGGWTMNFYPNGINAGMIPNPETIPNNFNYTASTIGHQFHALSRGYIIISAGARSRSDAPKGEPGSYEYTGKSPATVSDWKAVLRFVKYNIKQGNLPGDQNRIIVVGTSGGGALVSLLGATGNHPDYFPSLYEAGALGIERKGRNYINSGDDSIFVALPFCPMAYPLGGDYGYEYDFYPWRTAAYNNGDFAGSRYGDKHRRMAPQNNQGGQRPVHMWQPWEVPLSRALYNYFPIYAQNYDAITSVRQIEAIVVEMAEASLNRYLSEGNNKAALETALRSGAVGEGENVEVSVSFRNSIPMNWFTVDRGKATIPDFRAYTEYQFFSAQSLKKIAMTHDGGLLWSGAGVDGGLPGVDSGIGSGTRTGGLFGLGNEITAPTNPFTFAMIVERWGGPTGWTQGIVDWNNFNPAWDSLVREPWDKKNMEAHPDYYDWVIAQRLKMFDPVTGNLIPAAHRAWANYPNRELYEQQAKMANPMQYLMNDKEIAKADIASHWFIRTGLHDDNAAFSTYALLEQGLRTNPKILSHDHQLIVGLGHYQLTAAYIPEAFAWLDKILGGSR